MNRIHLLALIAMLAPLALTQDGRTPPPVTLRGNAQAISTQPGTEPAMRKDSSYEPPFCPPKTCLYYAGDFDSNDSNANGLFNADDTGGALEGLDRQYRQNDRPLEGLH